MQKTIIQLQEIISHQSEDIARISEEFYLQQREIEELRKKLDKLMAKIESMNQGDNEPMGYELPPHY